MKRPVFISLGKHKILYVLAFVITIACESRGIDFFSESGIISSDSEIEIANAGFGYRYALSFDGSSDYTVCS